jgi:hypothetical protein
MINLSSYGGNPALLMQGFSERLEPAVRAAGSFTAASSHVYCRNQPWRHAGECPAGLAEA